MSKFAVLGMGLGAALMVSCAGAVPEGTNTDRAGIAASPYNYLPGLVEVAGGYQLYGELDDPGVALDGPVGLHDAPAWLGPTEKLNFNGSNLAYELTEDVPTDCACPSLEAIGNHHDFLFEVDRALRSGLVTLDLDVFWTIRTPTVMFEAVVLEGNGERVVGSTTRTFEYPWRQRVNMSFMADLAGVVPGDMISIRMTLVDSDGALPQWVFNAGPADRLSNAYLPLAE
ncbi:MAG TPA: hypothetical protein VG389_20540 [Myxococcota bacterium]|jgi:hypothetical protein|nr:hypothetical protein [Myxococcota bacterium]